jgi:hypothetical protein
MGINMLLWIKAKDENGEEIKDESFMIKRLSINIWQIGETKSLIDYGFEIENSDDKPIERVEILVPYKVIEGYDITEDCYLNYNIAKTIFSKEYKLDKEGKIMIADGLISKVLTIANKDKNKIVENEIINQNGSTKIIIEFNRDSVIRNDEYHDNKKVLGAFRIRLLAENVPRRVVYFPRNGILNKGIHYGYIFDIPIYDKRHESIVVDENNAFPRIESLHLFIMPYANLHEMNINLTMRNLESKYTIRLLETKAWRKYLDITGHGKYLEDGRKVYRGDYTNISHKNRVRVFCEFEDPYSKVVLKILLICSIPILAYLAYLIYLYRNYFSTWIAIILREIYEWLLSNLVCDKLYDILKSVLEKITKFKK